MVEMILSTRWRWSSIICSKSGSRTRSDGRYLEATRRHIRSDETIHLYE